MKCIYKLSDCNGLVYFGSSEDIKKRLTVHKSKTKLGTNICMSKLLDWASMEMDVLDEYDDDDITDEDLKWKERWYIDNHECVNTRSPIITEEEQHERMLANKKQYYADNRDTKLVEMKEFRVNNPEKVKEYRDNHKDKAKVQKKANYQKNREKRLAESKQYHLDNPDYRKQYQLDNKEKIKETGRLYLEKNKEKIKEKASIYRDKNKEKLQKKREDNREKHRLYVNDKYKQDKILKQSMVNQSMELIEI